MKGLKGKLTALGLIFGILGGSLGGVHAYEGDFDVNKIETWNQYYYDDFSHERIRPDSPTTVGDAACGYFALATAAVKEGTVDESFNPEVFLNAVREKEAWNTTYGHFNFHRVEEFDIGLKLPEITKFGNAVRGNSGDAYYWSISGDWESKMDTVRDLWKEGYYIILCLTNSRTNGHYVFVDYVDEDGRIRMTDSAFIGTWIDEQYNGGFSYMIVLESIDGKKSNEQKSVYNHDDSSRGFNATLTFQEFIKNLDSFEVIQTVK